MFHNTLYMTLIPRTGILIGVVLAVLFATASGYYKYAQLHQAWLNQNRTSQHLLQTQLLSSAVLELDPSSPNFEPDRQRLSDELRLQFQLLHETQTITTRQKTQLNNLIDNLQAATAGAYPPADLEANLAQHLTTQPTQLQMY
jgi:hypothetical protein